ncbi:MAG: hypothetical protein H6Q72_918 [Firmicutes bacterium]|nr:hypothetical protein [Bacillota bacterium]
MLRVTHKNPLSQYYFNKIYWASIIATTFAELDQINRQIRKDNIIGRVA